MITTFYFIRHGESPKNIDDERNRGLTCKGLKDIKSISKLLENENINLIFSSPYQRSILTIKDFSEKFKIEINLIEELKECVFSNNGKTVLLQS